MIDDDVKAALAAIKQANQDIQHGAYHLAATELLAAMGHIKDAALERDRLDIVASNVRMAADSRNLELRVRIAQGDVATISPEEIRAATVCGVCGGRGQWRNPDRRTGHQWEDCPDLARFPERHAVVSS